MEIKHKIAGDVLVVSIEGELDSYSSQFVRDYLDTLFDKNNAKQIVFNLSGMNFMDSTGIGVFIGRYKKMKSRGVPIYISGPSDHAKKILEMSGLFEIMPLIS